MPILLLATSCSTSEILWPTGGPPLNEYFSLEITNEKLSHYNLKVDADMPGHGHGMITRPEVVKKENGTWLVNGMIFHMPGEWELYLDWEHKGETSHEIHAIDLKP